MIISLSSIFFVASFAPSALAYGLSVDVNIRAAASSVTCSAHNLKVPLEHAACASALRFGSSPTGENYTIILYSAGTKYLVPNLLMKSLVIIAGSSVYPNLLKS